MKETGVVKLGKELLARMPEGSRVEEKENGVTLTAFLDIGIKGVGLTVDCTDKTVKIKGTREYKYPVKEKESEQFLSDMQKRYANCSIFASGQTLSFSRFFSYSSEEEAIKIFSETLGIMKEAVAQFEDECVNFAEKFQALPQEEYDPGKAVKKLEVDDGYHAAAVTEKGMEEYVNQHREYTKQMFRELAGIIGGDMDGNEVIKQEEDGKVIRCIMYPEDAEMLVSVSVNAKPDVGAMYVAYINGNYQDLQCGYKEKNETFTVKQYVFPDEYSPDDAKEALKQCREAMDACVHEFESNLKKRESVDFASSLQHVLEKETAGIEEREKAVAAREADMARRDAEMTLKERDLNARIEALEKEKKEIEIKAEKEQERIQAKEQEIQERVKECNEAEAKNLMRIQQLANQVAVLQNRQSAANGMDEKTEEEIKKLESKVRQLNMQKQQVIARTNEQLENKEAKIRKLSDIITEKETEIKKLETTQNDIIQSKVNEEMKKTKERIQELEETLSSFGHILTPEELKDYFLSLNGDDMEIRETHSADSNFLIYNDVSLEVRIRFGSLNFVDVSKVAVLKDAQLKKINTKFGDIKFFQKDDRIVARAYFPQNASAPEVDGLIDRISDNFAK